MALNALKQMRRENVNNLELYKKVVRFQNGVEIICEVNHGVERVRINTPVALPAAAEDIDVVEEIVVPPVETEATICPAFEISDGSGNIVGILVCDTGEWTSTGTFYEVETSAADPFEYGNWMCHYDSKPFSGDLVDRELYNSDGTIITDIAPCGYHNNLFAVYKADDYTFNPVTGNIDTYVYLSYIDYAVDSGLIDLGGYTKTIKSFVDYNSSRNINLVTNNPFFQVGYSVIFNSLLIMDYTDAPFYGDPEYPAYKLSYYGMQDFDYTIVDNIAGSTNIYNEYIDGYYPTLWYKTYKCASDFIGLDPTMSGVYNESCWAAVYSSGFYANSQQFIIPPSGESFSSNGSYTYTLNISGNKYTSQSVNLDFYPADGDIEETNKLVQLLFADPFKSSLRLYQYGDETYCLGCIKETDIIHGYEWTGSTYVDMDVNNTSPKMIYFMKKLSDEEGDLGELIITDCLFDAGVEYHQLDSGPCYGKFRLVKIERPEEE